MLRERPLIMDGPNRIPLFGILHEPEVAFEPRVAVQLLNPGLKSRVAPNRLNVELGRRLAAVGYFVMRFDPPGVGDSGGDLGEHPLPDLWQRVQLGEFVEATRRANAVLALASDADEIVCIGNCGGAITALLSSRDEPRVRRLVLLDLPVTVRERDLKRQKTVRGKAQGRKVLRNYLRRARDPRAWLRAAGLRSDFRTIGRALRARFLQEQASDVVATPGDGEVLNPHFTSSFESFHERGGAALFVNAGNYDNTFTFNRLFGDPHLGPGKAYGDRHRRVEIPNANHVYGAPEWRAELTETVLGWLAEETVAPGRDNADRAGTVSRS